MTVVNKQILARKQIKYTKGSTSENKISKKHDFLDMNTPKSTVKNTNIIKLNTTGKKI